MRLNIWLKVSNALAANKKFKIFNLNAFISIFHAMCKVHCILQLVESNAEKNIIHHECEFHFVLISAWENYHTEADVRPIFQFRFHWNLSGCLLTVLKFQVVYCSRSLLHLYRQCQTFQPLWYPEIRRLANSLLIFFQTFFILHQECVQQSKTSVN